jgi:hypothetical protein
MLSSSESARLPAIPAVADATNARTVVVAMKRFMWISPFLKFFFDLTLSMLRKEADYLGYTPIVII